MLSNSSLTLGALGVFVVGALLFALGTWLIRREKTSVTPSAAPVIPSVAAQPRSRGTATNEDLELALDQIERLAIVGQPWCVEQLEREFLRHEDERLRVAAEDAIIVIRARGQWTQ